MKKNFLHICLICILCVLSLTGCRPDSFSRTPSTLSIDEEYPQGGFILHSGSPMVETPEGFYAFQDNYLYYITSDLTKSTILCGKPECTHNVNPSTNLYEAAECNAFFVRPQISYYEGYLYIAAQNIAVQNITAQNFQTETDDISTVVYQVSLDGSEKKIFFDVGQFINGMCIYKGDMYIADAVYTETGKKDRIRKISMKDPSDVKTLFETTDYPSSTLNRFECYGDFCYFFFTPGEEDGVYRYLRINLQTGEITTLHESSDDTSLLYMNDYGCIIEDQDVNRKNQYDDWLWDSTYYKIAPGDTNTVPLTEQDFPLLAETPKLENIDDTYIYLSSMHHSSWSEKSWPEDASIYVCTYDGEIAATIPLGREFSGSVFHALPGTEGYLFVYSQKYAEGVAETRYYYAPKAEFGDGATVQLKEIPME